MQALDNLIVTPLEPSAEGQRHLRKHLIHETLPDACESHLGYPEGGNSPDSIDTLICCRALFQGGGVGYYLLTYGKTQPWTPVSVYTAPLIFGSIK